MSTLSMVARTATDDAPVVLAATELAATLDATPASVLATTEVSVEADTPMDPSAQASVDPSGMLALHDLAALSDAADASEHQVPDVAAALLPAVALMTVPRVSLEVVAIGVAVFALVQSLVWLPLPFELVWVAIVALTVKRRAFYDRGHDIVFARQRRSRVLRGMVEGRAAGAHAALTPRPTSSPGHQRRLHRLRVGHGSHASPVPSPSVSR